MNGARYWRNRIPVLMLNAGGMGALMLFLRVNGMGADGLALILLIWTGVLGLWLGIGYSRRKKQLEQLLSWAEELEERYLLADIMKLPERAEDQVYYQILKMSGKSMLERIGEVERERLAYKEYIEQWIHEVKTPLTAMKLLCENNRSSGTRELLSELEKTNRFTEQALYYARMECAEKDYLIREISLMAVVHESIADNKYLLLRNKVSINLTESDLTVYSDEKWLLFILNQLLSNAVKYRKDYPKLFLNCHQENNQVILSIQDNGIGISESDLPRIYEKGFTGQNGRQVQNSTGIGLYLCKKLCDKLGIQLQISSWEQGTTVTLAFTINNYIHQGNEV